MERDRIQVLSSPHLAGVELRRGWHVRAPVARHWHEEYQLCLIQDGIGFVNFQGCNHPTVPKSLFIVPPGEVHSNACTSENGCTYETIFLDPKLLNGAPNLGMAVTDDPVLIESFSRVHRTLERGSSGLQAECVLNEFLRLLLSRHRHGPTGKKWGADQPGLAQAYEYLREHFAEEISLDRLAAQAGLSRFHFARAFADCYGSPPHLFQNQLRVVKAKALLREGHPIGEVALAVGFGDQSHLNRHFKRLTAVTPGQYKPNRKNIQDA